MPVRIRKPPDWAEGPLWEHSAAIVEDLREQGYSPNTIYSKLWLVARLSRWLEKQALTLADLSPAELQRFENHADTVTCAAFTSYTTTAPPRWRRR